MVLGVIRGYFAGILSYGTVQSWQDAVDGDTLPKGAGVFTGRELLDFCQNPATDHQNTCGRFIAGVLDASTAIRRDWRLPNVSVGQVKDIAVQYLTAHH